MIQTSLDRAPVVVAVDGSDDSQEAAAWAAERASEWGAPLHMVATVPGGVGEPTAGPVPCWLGVPRVAAWRAGRDPDVTESVRGDLLEVLADRGSHARLLVVPNSLAGSVSLALAERVGCPVVVCRDGTAHPSVMPTSRPTGGRPRTTARPVRSAGASR
jgi:nucleotide-binding universal stress UspA family protein